MQVDWAAFEAAWLDAVLATIRDATQASPTERFYAGAFWLLYGDYTKIGSAAFGLGSEPADLHAKWHPPDWRLSLLAQDDGEENLRRSVEEETLAASGVLAERD